MPKPYQRMLFAQERPPAETPGGRERVPVRLWQLDDTREKAVQFSREPDSGLHAVWVPRSLMGERIDKRRDPGAAYWECRFTLPKWKADELDLDYE